MAKEKVTLTLDAEKLRELRSLVGSRSLSATVDVAISAYVARMRHLSAVDEWLAELERKHGPVPAETLEWAAGLVGKWDSASRGGRRRAG
jgi:predicted transcriptional regulator